MPKVNRIYIFYIDKDMLLNIKLIDELREQRGFYGKIYNVFYLLFNYN